MATANYTFRPTQLSAPIASSPYASGSAARRSGLGERASQPLPLGAMRSAVGSSGAGGLRSTSQPASRAFASASRVASASPAHAPAYGRYYK